jgi:small subunit ribosomal protein S13
LKIERRKSMQLFQKRLSPASLVSIGLSEVVGIGRRSAADICARVGLGVDCRIADLTENQMRVLRFWLENREREVKAKLVKESSSSPFARSLSSPFAVSSASGSGSKEVKVGKGLSFSKVKDQPGLVYGLLEGSLRMAESANIHLAVESGSYRGKRHAAHLPCRGQRTHTNAKSLRHKHKSKLKK